MSWMIEINGFIVDARYLKRKYQEEAFRKGSVHISQRRKGDEDTDQASVYGREGTTGESHE